ncbi:MAG: hypothetical protein MUF27_12465 [Acidobacteria bacterium]|jgi:hypothetical protein|nr:hypothetical protein [Acidobacteriota bacterium]
MPRRFALLVVFTLLALGAAEAALPALAGGWELTPILGYRYGGSARETESGTEANIQGSVVYGLILNLKAREDGQFEFLYTHQGTELDLKDGYVPFYEEPVQIDPGLAIDTLQFGGLLFLSPNPRSRPYIVMTLGASLISPEDPDLDGGTYFSGSFGGGWKLYPSKNVGVRLELRGYGTFASDSSEIACSGGGGGGVCFVGASGWAIWQIEASVGLILRF